MNSSRPTVMYFEFTVFVDYGNLRYLFFTLCLFVYLTIISANMIIVVIIILEKSLHEPMYIFICCLSINSLYGSAGFFPRFLFDLLSDTHFISRPSCFTQIYVIYTYASCEFTILGVMAYDRFVAICQPLHYHTKMTMRKVVCLWAAAVVYPALALSCGVAILSQLYQCGHKIPRIFCGFSHSNISCANTSKSEILGYFVFFTTVFIPLFSVLYSYLRILIVCRRGSNEARGKTLKTCVPHLVTFFTYSCLFFIEVLVTRFDSNKINPLVKVVLSLEYLMVSSINNPLIYGLKLPKIRRAIFRLFQIKNKI